MTLTNCSIVGNLLTYPYNSYGGGIYGGTLTITDGSIADNTSDGQGGGLYAVSGQVNGCLISGNTSALEGGGVWSNGSLTLSWTTVEDNHSSTTGGAWYKSYGTALVQNCTVRNNSATTVGGLRLGSGLTTMLGSSFCGNGVNVHGSWTDSGGNSLTDDCGPQCPGDATGDGLVNAEDLAELFGSWGPCAGAPCVADFNGDGMVAGADLAITLSGWGACP